MSLVSFQDVTLGFGGHPVLDHASFSIGQAERVALIGRNGEGKSTLIRLITGEQTVEDGRVVKATGMTVAEMPQDIPTDIVGPVRAVVASGAGPVALDVAEYNALLETDPMGDRLGDLATRIDAVRAWGLDEEIDLIVGNLGLSPASTFESLSGGQKRRVLLGRALAGKPDLLLLDEPTNHLDLESIGFLENFLKGWAGSVLFITHDRAFLRAVATRILELDRGRVSSWPGDYDNYLRRRDERLHAESQENARFDKLMSQEEVWIRQGVQARRTRDMGRVKRLLDMRRDYANRRTVQGTAVFSISTAAASGKLVAEAKNITYAWDGQDPVVADFSTTLLRGDKVGIVGPNGAGKTTLLNLLLGRLVPQTGSVRNGSNIAVAWFDQLRAGLDDQAPVYQNIGGGREFVTTPTGQKHVMGYLQDFLFTPERARQPTYVLSGGERARLLLARLFAEPANLLILDEPTNDLDIETLDLLEERIASFPGTVLTVSHDREFLDNVATRTLVLEGRGKVADVAGGYSDWLRERGPVATKGSAMSAPTPSAASVPAASTLSATVASASTAPRRRADALNGKEKRELDELPGTIERLEAEQEKLTGELSGLYGGTDAAKTRLAQERLTKAARTLATTYARWEELEARKNG